MSINFIDVYFFRERERYRLRYRLLIFNDN